MKHYVYNVKSIVINCYNSIFRIAPGSSFSYSSVIKRCAINRVSQTVPMGIHMDFINNCFKEYRSSFIQKLGDVEITGDLADAFLAETAARLLYIIKTTNLEKIIKILLSDKPSHLLDLIDTDAMAIRLDMHSEQVISGLDSIAPVMSQVFSLKSNEIIAATASLAWKTSDEFINNANNI